MTSPASATIDTGAAWWAAADRILISAGAGLSAAAGIDYGDTEDFARLFPALVRRGFTARYQLIGFNDWSESEKWGYWAAHVHDVRFAARHSTVYAQLRDLVRGKDYFVLTSNVDAMFVRHGFDGDRIYTPQGDYAALQCLRPCCPTTWPTEPVIARLLPAIDRDTQTVRDATLLPACPRCDGAMFPNVRAGGWFLEQPYTSQRARFLNWLEGATDGRLLIAEFGAGFNTPGVVRLRDERLANTMPAARLLRVNPAAAEVPEALGTRALGLALDAGTVISGLRDRVETTD